jgi:transposase
VKRGLSRREAATIRYLGIDEKQFRSGQSYISSLVDLQGGRVLDVVEERTEQACKALIEQLLNEQQRQQVTAVALDMWKAYANAVGEKLPQADIVHDRFPISQHLNEAVDKVRRKENKLLLKQGDNRLVGTKFTWLVNEERISEVFAE